MTQTVPQTALTHAGIFHADDVFAAALLRILNPTITIVRSNAVPPTFDGLVFDIGGGEFDHHQGTPPCRENGVPYSSFGLLWRRFGGLLLCPDDVQILDEQLVQPIDLTDNTGEPNPLSQCVSDFNPTAMGDPAAYDEAFFRAVDFAQGILGRRLDSLRSQRADIDEVRRLMDEGDGRVLVLPRVLRWKHAVVGSGYLFVIYPSIRGGFNIQCVPAGMDTVETVACPPREWWGLLGDELKHVSGNAHLTFCHKSGYLMSADTLEAAVDIANGLADSFEKGDGGDV